MLTSLFDSKYTHKQKVMLGLLLLTILVVGAIGGYVFVARSNGPIPADLRTKLTFSPFIIPLSSKTYSTTDYKFLTAENNIQIFSYQVRTKDTTVAISQYPQPQQFAEIPEYKERFLSNVAKQYESIQTANGPIYLGRMERQHNKQLGVMLEKGLLVFMSPDKEMEPAAWRNLGDQLELQKTTY